MSDDPSVDGDQSPTRSSDLFEDLRRVAGSRTPKALRDAHLPALQEWLDHPDDSNRKLDELRAVVESGIAAISDPQFRSAAEELFGFGAQRWTPLRTRGERASASFSCSFDAYRRARRSTGTSLLDETIEQLADAIRQHGPAGSPEVGSPSATPRSEPTSHPSPAGPDPRRRHLAVAAGALAAVVVVAIAAVVLVNRADRSTGSATAPSTTDATNGVVPTPTARCRYPIGSTDDEALAAYRTVFTTQVAQLTPPGDVRPCGAAPVSTWGALTIQPLSVDGKASGELVAIDPDHVLLMTQAEFSSYHQIGGKNGNQAQALAGLPRRRRTTKSGRGWLIITDHGAMVSQGVDQPGFYVGGPVWTRWEATGEDTGELGMPASNPLNNAVGYYQDFERGRLTLTYSGTLSFSPVSDPAASLPAHFRGQILRHDDGTTWYVDQAGARHWIPDGETWACLHDKGSKELGGVPGYATATLPLGAPATCTPKR
jgi:hypothetical protein